MSALVVQIRRNTRSGWANTVLKSGEIGLETDTGTLRVGDGSTPWQTLPSISGGAIVSTFSDLRASTLTISTINGLPYASGGTLTGITAGTGITVDNTNPAAPLVANAGVISLTAGSNILINNTDPANPSIAALANSVFSTLQTSSLNVDVLQGSTISNTIVVNASLIPALDNTYDLGAVGSSFRHLYVAGSTIFLGNATISADVEGNVYTTNVEGYSTSVTSQLSSFNTLSASSIQALALTEVSSINGLPYSSGGGGGPTISSFNDLSASTIQTSTLVATSEIVVGTGVIGGGGLNLNGTIIGLEKTDYSAAFLDLGLNGATELNANGADGGTRAIVLNGGIYGVYIGATGANTGSNSLSSILNVEYIQGQAGTANGGMAAINMSVSTITNVSTINGVPYTGMSGSNFVSENFTVATDSVGGIIYSYDGITWTTNSAATAVVGTCKAVAWNGSYWMAVGDGVGTTPLATIATSPDGINWTSQTDSILGSGRAVAWNGSIWVAVGSGIIFSSDGVNWTPAANDPFSPNPKNGVAWNGRYWVVVGNGITSTQAIATSPDGLNWTLRSSPFDYIVGRNPGIVNTIAWNGTVWAAGGEFAQGPLGDPLPTSIAISTDGITWSQGSNVPEVTITSIAWNGIKWLAFTPASNQVITSMMANGSVWGTMLLTGATGLRSVTWNGSLWLVAGTSSSGAILATSPDGETWTYRTTSLSTQGQVISSRRVLPFTYNLSADTLYANALTISTINGLPYSSGGGGGPSTTISSFNDLSASTLQVLALTEVSTINGLSVAANVVSENFCVAFGNTEPGKPVLAYSYDGIKWSVASQNALLPGNSATIAWNGSYWLAFVGSSEEISGSFFTSSDGINWNIGIAITDIFVNNLAWNGSFWVAAGSSTNTSNSGIMTSSNGINWTTQLIAADPFGGAGETAVAWNGSYWVVVGNTDTTTIPIATSTDGRNWTPRTSFLNGNSVLGIAWNGRLWVAVGEGPSPIAISANGITWQVPTILPNAWVASASSIAWNGLVWVAASTESDSVAVSANGQNWAKSESTGLSGSVKSITWNGSNWIAIGVPTNSNSNMSISPNGLIWTPISTSSAFGLFSQSGLFITSRRVLPFTDNVSADTLYANALTISTINGLPYSSGGGGSTSTISTFATLNTSSLQVSTINGLPYIAPTLSENFTVAAIEYSLYYSYNGITWSRSSGLNEEYRTIIWNGSYWLAGGPENSSIASLRRSSDGIKWSSNISSPFSTIYGLAWNGSLWVAVGDGSGSGTGIATSPDGITWTDSINDPFLINSKYGVAWNGSYWVVVGNRGDGGTAIATSYDGMNWTARTSPFKNAEDIVWNGSLWIAVGITQASTPLIAISPDGIIWTTRTSPLTAPANVIGWNGSILLAAAGPEIVRSLDGGMTWEAVVNFPTSIVSIAGISWNGSLWIVSGNIDTAIGQPIPAIVTSPDTVTWTGQPSSAAIALGGTAVASRRVLPFSSNFSARTLYADSLTISSINGLPYSSSGGGPSTTISSFNDLHTSTLEVSSINGLPYTPGTAAAVGPPGAIQYTDGNGNFQGSSNFILNTTDSAIEVAEVGNRIALNLSIPDENLNLIPRNMVLQSVENMILVASTNIILLNSTGTGLFLANENINLSVAHGNMSLFASTLQIDLQGSLGTAGQVLTSDGVYATWQPPSGGGGGPTISSFNDLHTSTLEVSSINGLPYTPGTAVGPTGAIQYTDGNGNFQGSSIFLWDPSKSQLTAGPASNTIGFDEGFEGSSISITSVAHINLNATFGNIALSPSTLQISLPTGGSGSAGQVLTSDGEYATWQTPSGGGGGPTISSFDDLRTSTLHAMSEIAVYGDPPDSPTITIDAKGVNLKGKAMIGFSLADYGSGFLDLGLNDLAELNANGTLGGYRSLALNGGSDGVYIGISTPNTNMATVSSILNVDYIKGTSSGSGVVQISVSTLIDVSSINGHPYAPGTAAAAGPLGAIQYTDGNGVFQGSSIFSWDPSKSQLTAGPAGNSIEFGSGPEHSSITIYTPADFSITAITGNILLNPSTLQISLLSGGSGTVGQVLTSDGVYATWQTPSGGGGGTTISSFNDLHTSTLHTSTLQVSSINGFPATAPLPAESFTVAADFNGNMVYSYDGLLWNTANIPVLTSNTTYAPIAWSGSYWLAAGSSNTYTSVDGINWVTGPLRPLTYVYDLAWNGSLWVAVGRGNNGLATSPDGILWTITGSDWLGEVSDGLQAVAWNGSYWVMAGYRGTGGFAIATSYDGLTWTPRSSPFNTDGDVVMALAWNGSLWVAVGSNSSSKIAYSPDGINWTAATVSASVSTGGSSVAWNGRIWVAAFGNKVVSSVDGLTWGSVAITITTLSYISSIVWNGSLWIATGSDQPNETAIATSPDAISWNAKPTPESFSNGEVATSRRVLPFGSNFSARTLYADSLTISSINGMPYSGGGNTFTNLITSTLQVSTINGISYSGPTLSENFCLASNALTQPNGGVLAYSYDGIKWSPTNYSFGTNGAPKGIAWNGSYWLMAGGGFTHISSDGINWISSATGCPATSFGWNGSMWVGVGPSMGGDIGIYISLDGLNWTLQNSNDNTVPSGVKNGIAWNGSYWVVVGGNAGNVNTTTIATSPDGVNWTARVCSVLDTKIAYGIAWNGYMWIAVGEPSGVGAIQSGVALSYDGITWVAPSNPPSFTIFKTIIWNGSMWLTTDDERSVSTSLTGETWTTAVQIPGTGSIKNITWNGSLWIAIGPKSSASSIMATSPDGITWTAINTTPPFPSNDNTGNLVVSRRVLPFSNNISARSLYAPILNVSTINGLPYTSGAVSTFTTINTSTLTVSSINGLNTTRSITVTNLVLDSSGETYNLSASDIGSLITVRALGTIPPGGFILNFTNQDSQFPIGGTFFIKNISIAAFPISIFYGAAPAAINPILHSINQDGMSPPLTNGYMCIGHLVDLPDDPPTLNIY